MLRRSSIHSHQLLTSTNSSQVFSSTASPGSIPVAAADETQTCRGTSKEATKKRGIPTRISVDTAATRALQHRSRQLAITTAVGSPELKTETSVIHPMALSFDDMCKPCKAKRKNKRRNKRANATLGSKGYR
ncbi:unnamed protein product [Ectocarpus sp. 12 AP-2014]